MTTPSQDSRADPAKDGAAWLRRGAIAIVAAAALLVLTFGQGRDQAIYTMVARSVVDGGMPYRDAWDFKPPGIFAIYTLARALFGAAPWGIRVIEALGLVATSFGLVVLARRLWKDATVGHVAAALAALVHAQLDFWHTAQPETFGGMLTVAALVVALRAAPRGPALVAAGALFGLAGLLKPPLAGGGAVLALWLSLRRRRDDPDASPRDLLAPFAWVLLGGVTPFAVTFAVFAARGALADLHQTLFVFTPHYTALGWEGRLFGAMLYQAVSEWLVEHSSAMGLGLLLLLARGPAGWSRPGLPLLLGIVGIQLLGVALQGKFFPYHYAGLWPVTALIAALGWVETARALLARGRMARVGLAALVLAGLLARSATKDVHGTFWRRAARRLRVFTWDRDDQPTIDGLATVADLDAQSNRRVAAALRSLTPEGEPIYVWGFEPALYDLADRPPASRYIYNIPQRVPWSASWARPMLLADLAAHPPAAIVVVDNDALPHVTGDGRTSVDLVDGDDPFVELRQMLQRDYRRATAIQDFTIFTRTR
ncbi:MAG: glycosyltransferase family 39 protein [Polyangiaceae bacterium]